MQIPIRNRDKMKLDRLLAQTGSQLRHLVHYKLVLLSAFSKQDNMSNDQIFDLFSLNKYWLLICLMETIHCP